MRGLRLVLILGSCGWSCSTLAESSYKKAEISVRETPRKKVSLEEDLAGRASLKQPVLLQDAPEKELFEGIASTIAYLKKTLTSFDKNAPASQKLQEKILNLLFEQAVFKKDSSSWKEVIAYARDLVQKYPTAGWLDRVYYHEAVALQFINMEDDAARIYTKIITDYPNSTRKGESLFSLGEFYFHKYNFSKAKSLYEQSMIDAPLKRKVWAQYKIGWCLFNLENYGQSLSIWKQTVSEANQLGPGGRGIAGEALHDLVYAYVQTPQVSEALSYMSTHGDESQKYATLMFLGANLVSQSKWREAERVYRSVLSLKPRGFEFVDAYEELLALYYSQKNYGAIWPLLNDAFQRLGDTDQTIKPSDRALAAQKIQRLSLYYPKLIHRDAQQSKQSDLWTQARRGYLEHLGRYPESSDYAEANFYLGDVSYELKNYTESGAAFARIAVLGSDRAVIYDDAEKIKENIYKKSSENMLDAYSKDFEPEYKALVKESPDFAKGSKSKTLKAKNFLLACDAYLKWFPQDSENQKNCDLYKSEIEFRTNSKPLALAALKEFAIKYSQTPVGLDQAEKLMGVLKDDKPQAMVFAKMFLQVPSFRQSEFGDKLRTLIKGAKLEQISSEGSPDKRAPLLEEFATAHAGDKNADKIFYKAGEDYYKAGLLKNAQKMFAWVVKSYPQSEIYPDALLELAKSYEKSFSLRNSAEAYDLFAQKFPKHPSASAVHQKRCLLWVELKDPKLFGACSTLMATDPGVGADLWMNALDSAWMERDMGFLKSAADLGKWDQWNFTGSERMRYSYYFAKVSPAWVAKAGALAQSAPGNLEGQARRFAGEILFRGAEPLLKQAQRGALQGGNVPNLQGSIEKWTALLNRAEKSLTPLFSKLKDAYWSSAGLYELAMGYQAFGKALENPPAIAEAPHDAVKEQLKGSADQVLAKSKEFLETGLKLNADTKLYSDYTPRWSELKRNPATPKEPKAKGPKPLKDLVSLDIPQLGGP